MNKLLIFFLVLIFVIIPILVVLLAIFGLFTFGLSVADTGYCYTTSDGKECMLMSENDCQKKGGVYFKTFDECQAKMKA